MAHTLALAAVVACALVSAGAASSRTLASCDWRFGSQFSNSAPDIAVTANNLGNFPGHISVGVISWGPSGGVHNLGGGYYEQHYETAPYEYTPGSPVSVQFSFPNTAGDCASQPVNRTINVVS